MDIANYILAIFRMDLMVVLSWGIHNAKVIEGGLAFNVQGYKFKGRVEVIYDEGMDLFTVRLIKADGKVKEEVEGVYVDGLLDTIDKLVERVPDYKQKVRKTYGL